MVVPYPVLRYGRRLRDPSQDDIPSEVRRAASVVGNRSIDLLCSQVPRTEQNP